MSSFLSIEVLPKEMATYSLLQGRLWEERQSTGGKKLDVRVGRQAERVS